jgi:hypothetical protein
MVVLSTAATPPRAALVRSRTPQMGIFDRPTTGPALSSNFAGTIAGAALAVLVSLPSPFAVPALQPLPAYAAAKPAVAASPTTSASDRSYINFAGFPFPLGPFTSRATVQTELVPNRVYSFEQTLDLAGITANQRSVVFRMRDNHLLVYNPVAPTKEFLAQLDGLQSKGVAHILLGATQYEHKVFVAPFARRFPEAKVWAVPDQWSFPLDLPSPLLGIDEKGSGGGELTDTLPATSSLCTTYSGLCNAAYARAPDLTAEFEVKLLRPKERLGFGYAANEAALYHKDTKVLALTDALVNVPSAPPPVFVTDGGDNLRGIGDDARRSSSLGHLILQGASAVNWRGSAAEAVEELWSATDAAGGAKGGAAAQLQRGWERDALLSLFFGPSPASIVDPAPSFALLADKWRVAPVTDTLIYRSERVRPELRRWVDDVARWDFTTIAPSHFAVRPGTPADLKTAFAPTLASCEDGAPEADRPFDAADAQLLDDIAGPLRALKII